MKVTISYESAMTLLGCNWEKCDSACCRYPFGVFCREEAEGSECYYLSKEGCIVPWQERPIACLLFPFVITEEGRLILHLNARPTDETIFGLVIDEWTALVPKPKFACRQNRIEIGKLPAILTHYKSLSLIFGEELKVAIDELIKCEQDIEIGMLPEMAERWQKEKEDKFLLQLVNQKVCNGKN